jgi:hypothetical protein
LRTRGGAFSKIADACDRSSSHAFQASAPLLGIAAQQRRWMQRYQHPPARRVFMPAAALAHHGHVASQQRARRDRAQREQRDGLHQCDFAFEPVVAGIGLALRGCLVDAALAAQLVLEMLHRVGHVEPLARPSEFRHGAIEQPPGRAHERPTRQILLVARLLADHHQPRMHRPFAEDRLRRALAQRALAAGIGRVAELAQRDLRRLQAATMRRHSASHCLQASAQRWQ